MGLFKPKNKRGRNISETPSAVNKNTYKKVLVKASTLLGVNGRDRLSTPEHDLEEIRNACDADSYIKVALMKYSYMLFKAGYVLRSDNEKACEYIKTRFNIMSFATRTPMDILLQQCGDDLIKFSNAILVKSRVAQVMSGVKAVGFFKEKPVGGYFRVDPATINVEKNDLGEIVKYVQYLNGEERKFDAIDVVHIYLDKEAGNTFGTPRIIAALEDVKFLRMLEGHIATMIHRFAMPLFHWIIGKPVTGFQATNREIDEAENKLNNMALDGTIITNERSEIKVVGAQGNAISAEGYLAYFEQRVFTALGVSESQMGRGGAKQDADSMESQAHDTVKHIQRTMSIFIEEFIINELLLEGGFNPILNDSDKVKFVFNEINIDTKIKVENHEMAKFQSNMVTYDEMRRMLGKKGDVNVDDLYKIKIEVEADKRMTEAKMDGAIKLANVNSNNAIKLARENGKLANANSSSNSNEVTVAGNGTNKSVSPNSDIANKNTPENQHGKTSVKVKEAVSNVTHSKEEHKDKYESIYTKYFTLCNDVARGKDDLDILFPLAAENLLSELRIYLNIASVDGVSAATFDIRKMEKKTITLPRVQIPLNKFEEDARKSIKKTLEDIKRKIEHEEDANVIRAIFESMEYRIRFLLEYVLPKVYWYSYLKTGSALNYKKAKIDFDGSDDEIGRSKTVILSEIDLDEIPPFHPFCDCKITFMKGAKK